MATSNRKIEDTATEIYQEIRGTVKVGRWVYDIILRILMRVFGRKGR